MSKKKTVNVLRGTRCYLIGHMEYLNGRGWREGVKKTLKSSGITFFDPYCKPFIEDVPEDENARQTLNHWMETGQYDLVHNRMKDVRSYDLRLCDVSDFFIVNIVPKVASWGSAEEIVTAVRSKKPVFISINDPKGKAACPLWLMGMIPHKYVYNNVGEIIEVIKKINSGSKQIDNERWKLLRSELR